MKIYKLYIIGFILAGTLFACQNRSDNVTSTEAKSTKEVTINEDSLINLGANIAKQTFKTLSGHLQQQLQSGGVESAIKYCNLQAYPLTDSLSKEFNVTIKRVAERNRNNDNALNELDKEVFEGYKQDLADSVKITPQLKLNSEGKYVFYAPIQLKPMCVTCHGSKEQIGSNYELISSLYPNDKAIDFLPGDLRGMWNITFN